MEKLEVREGYVVCRLWFAKPTQVREGGKVTTAAGIVLDEGIAKKGDILEFDVHPLVAEVIKSGGSTFGREGDYLLIPGRMTERILSGQSALDGINIGGKEFVIIGNELCNAKLSCIDKKKYMCHEG